MKRIFLLSLLALPALGMDAPLPNNAPVAAQVEEIECTICMEPIKCGDSFSKTPCNHSYHYTCFNQFSLTQARHSCPNCRGKLTEETLTQLRNAPSGTIKQSVGPAAPVMAQAPADFLTRVKNVFSPSLPVIPVNEVTQKLMDTSRELKKAKETKKELAHENEELLNSKRSIEANLRSDIERLIDKNKALQAKIDEQKQSFEIQLQKIIASNPDLAQVEALKNSIKVLGQEKESLQKRLKAWEELGNEAAENLRSCKIANREWQIAYSNLDKEWEAAYKKLESEGARLLDNYKQVQNLLSEVKASQIREENAKNLHRYRHQALRERLVHLSSWAIAATTGYLAYKYLPNHSKVTTLFASGASLAASYIWGSKYINKCYQQDLRDAQA